MISLHVADVIAKLSTCSFMLYAALNHAMQIKNLDKVVCFIPIIIIIILIIL